MNEIRSQALVTVSAFSTAGYPPHRRGARGTPPPGGRRFGGCSGRAPIHGQVGGDHRPLVRRQTGIDEGVEGGLDEGGGKLAAQIVQNQQSQPR